MTEPAAVPSVASAQKLVVVGQGYVGLPIAMRAVQVGYNVLGVDVEQSRVDRLLEGSSYIEDITDEALRAALNGGRYSASTSYDNSSAFDFAIITVPTPLREGSPDLSFIERAAASLAPYVTVGATVVLESTTYPGTTDELLIPILEDGSGLTAGHDFYVGYSPERIDPGNTRFGLVNTPKVISGIGAESLDAVARLYRSLVDEVVIVSSCKVAELAKLLENTFRHVNIALVNELAMFARDLGIDIWEAIDASSTKPFGYMRFTPGPGVGGHCLPVDPSYLSWRVKRTLGTPFRFVELANDINEHMPDYVTRRVITLLNDSAKSVRGSRILLLGLAYKKNTSDIRESPGLLVGELLAGLGAEIRCADPHVDSTQLGTISSLQSNKRALSLGDVEWADLVILLIDHDDFDYDLLKVAAAILDCRHRLSPRPNVAAL